MKKLLATLVLATVTSTTAVNAESRYFQNLSCMAEVIYRESKGEPYLGQLAVGQVVLNRAKHPLYPNTICEVIFQKGQFEWVSKFRKFEAPPQYIRLAKVVLSGKHEMQHFKATHFHANYVNPRWKLKHVATIGNHIFYKHHERLSEKRYSSGNGSRASVRRFSNGSEGTGGRIKTI